MKSGVYQIVCLPTGCQYIGSAVDYGKRFAYHKWQLGRGQHPNRHLQRAWDKHGGADAFLFGRFISCEPADLIDCEQWAIDALRPKLNILRTAASVLGLKWTGSARARHKKTWVEKVAPKLDRTAHRAAVQRAWQAGAYDQGMRARSNQYPHNGRTYTLREAAGVFGINANTLKYRLAKGVPFARAIAQPLVRGGRFAKWTYQGQKHTMAEVATLCGVKATTIQKRMARGVPFEQAVQINLG